MLFCWSQGGPGWDGCSVSPGFTRHSRGSCVSPSVHRQPALFRDRAGSTRASVERRSPSPDCAAHQSGDRSTARLRVCGLRGPRGRRRSDPAVQPAAIQRPAAGRQRSTAPGRPAGRAPAWWFQRPASWRSAFGVQQSQTRRLLAATGRGRRRGGARSRNFGPDAPPKNKRKPNRKDSDRGPKGPIKERPVGRLYDADEDWRAKDEVEDVEVDNFATSAKKDDVEDDNFATSAKKDDVEDDES